ncbi:MAG: glycoside hydrolase family 5 protein [Lachnospiraceae bacterium]|nr:glycoside hydrolase family 5 protein [Lachnospiraceae bacterium]
MRKKIISVLAAATLVISMLTGCGATQTEGNNNSAQESSQAESTVESTGQEQTSESAKEPEATEAPVVEKDSITAIEMAHRMGNGINLGNTMEAYGRSSVGVGAATSVYETHWGQPVTTPEMIQAMKDAGFDTLRIPVAWTNAMNFESGDYTIGTDYLNRVEEIINYALDADMYVIVNDHWDGGWWGMFGSATPETREAAMELYTSMWTQIATKYEKYDEHLIFESGNEELGFRLNDTDIAADSGTLSDEECYVVTNQINQAFVDTIRSAGGNNADRFLLIAGFGTDITNTCKDGFKMPTDTVDDKLLLSVHYYDPSGYCLWESVANWGSKKDYSSMNEMLAKLTQFTEQGYGIVIGEYGVLNQQNGLRENTLEYTENFLDNCDYYGYCPVLWDCSDMFIRTEGKMRYDEVAQMYLDHSYATQSAKTLEEIQTAARAEIDAATEAAPEAAGVSENTAMAWIMYSSSDWGISYSVGDVYSPDSGTAGIVATDVEITGEGTYTVGLDFTGTSGGYANSVVFSAVGIANGELLYPGYCIEIKEILVNGEPYKLTGRPYTASDDKKCTRVNLYNEWVSAVPDDARTAAGNAMYVSPCVIDAATLGNVETIQVTFDYVPGK